ncbi:MAG: hypothetical protein ACKOQ6_02840, partial [Bacteroidota bacterium]
QCATGCGGDCITVPLIGKSAPDSRNRNGRKSSYVTNRLTGCALRSDNWRSATPESMSKVNLISL